MTPLIPECVIAGVSTRPSETIKTLLAVPPTSSPSSSHIRPSAIDTSCHSARASTCSRRPSVFSPAVTGLRPAMVSHQRTRICVQTGWAAGTPHPRPRLAADAVAVHSHAVRAHESESASSHPHRFRLQQPPAECPATRRSGAGRLRRVAPAYSRSRCRSRKRGLERRIAIVSKRPSP